MSMKELFVDGSGAKRAKVRSSILTSGKKKPSAKTESTQPNGASAEQKTSKSAKGSPKASSPAGDVSLTYFCLIVM